MTTFARKGGYTVRDLLWAVLAGWWLHYGFQLLVKQHEWSAGIVIVLCALCMVGIAILPIDWKRRY